MPSQPNITPVAWSISQLVRTMAREGVLHMQGFDYGKPERTLCGRSYNAGGHWDFEFHDYPPDEFQGCKRCEAAYRRFVNRST